MKHCIKNMSNHSCLLQLCQDFWPPGWWWCSVQRSWQEPARRRPRWGCLQAGRQPSHRHELEKALTSNSTNKWLLSIVRCHLHARQVQVQRDTPLHGDLCNLVWSEGWSLFKSRSSPLNQSDRTYSWWQDCQLGSGTSLYWSQGHIREKSLPISASKVHQTHTFEHDRGSC